MKRATISRIYVPSFCGNKDLEEGQVTVEMDLATIKEKDEFANIKYGKKGKMEFVKKEYTAIRRKVEKINDYFDDTGKPIDTAEKLIEDMKAGSPESNELCVELWNRIMGYDSTDSEEEESEELTTGEE